MCRHTHTHTRRAAHAQTHSAAGVLDFVFLLSADVIVFLMVLEVITPCNVTQRLLLSSKPQHGGSDVPYIHNHSPPQMTPLARMHPQSLLVVREYEACLTGSIQGRWGQTHKQIISYTQFKMAVGACVCVR